MDELHVVDRLPQTDLNGPPSHVPLEAIWNQVACRARVTGRKGNDLDLPRVGRRGRQRDCLWVAKLQDKVVGMVHILHEGPHVARLHCFRIQPQWQHTPVLTRLIDCVHGYCWNEGYLKLLVESRVTPRVVQQMLHHRGFQLIRRKRIGDSELLEYLVDLYYPPRQASESP